jgi:hypothetical protein
MRRTEVRPTFNRRAISDLLTPARCSFRISTECKAAVAGRPNLLPFWACVARPSRVRSCKPPARKAAKTASMAAHGPSGGRGQIQGLGQRYETHSEML